MTKSDRDVGEFIDHDGVRIKILSEIQGIRRRPHMYVGDMANPGVLCNLIQFAVEIAICDERAGCATQLMIALNADGSCEVRDDGVGLPADTLCRWSEETEAQKILENGYLGGRFTLGVTNALSSHLQATIYRSGKIYRLAYEWGSPLAPQRILGDAGDCHGNEIVFSPDPEIFKDTRFEYPLIAQCLSEMATKYPAVTIILEDRRGAEIVREQWGPGS